MIRPLPRHQLFSDEDEYLGMLSAPSFYADSIAFIYQTIDGAKRDSGFSAVGFIVSVRSAVRSTERYYYLVTNDHVIDEFDSVVVRINGLPLFKILSIPK